MKKKLAEQFWFRLLVISGLSVIFAGLFYVAYNLVHHTLVVTFSFIFIIIVAWNWGKLAGVLMVTFDTFWTLFIIHTMPPPLPPKPAEAIFGTLIHLSIALLAAVVGSLTRKLRSEIAVRTATENTLKEYQNRLEEMVQKRTQELKAANERLHHAEKMEAIGHLAGGIAHDFNNQLTIVLGYCELLLKSLDENSPQSTFAKKIQISGKRASDLTKQLLAFARKGVYKSQVVDINALSGEIVSLLSRSLKNIEIIQNLHACNPYVWGGASQLQNALLNLALNARDAMEHGGKLTIETETIVADKEIEIINNRSLPPGSYVSVSVKDTGTGIDQNTLKHIFEPFFTTKDEGKGTGMGLAAVYGIVGSHNGGIKVETSLGKGSSFTLLFPSVKSTGPDLTKDTSMIKKTECKAHVLVIDDEQDVTDMIREMLETIGCNVSVAYGGKEAVELYTTDWKKINLVVLDMVMPGMNGMEAYKALKKINPEIKVIISSGYSLNENVDEIIKDGASIFLQKPFKINELALNIQNILSESPE